MPAEPSFLADPNHRRKTLVGEFYKLLKKPKTAPEDLTEKQKKKMKSLANSDEVYIVDALPLEDLSGSDDYFDAMNDAALSGSGSDKELAFIPS